MLNLSLDVSLIRFNQIDSNVAHLQGPLCVGRVARIAIALKGVN